MKKIGFLSAFALILILSFSFASGSPGDGRLEWTRNSSLMREGGGWEGAARLWNWTGGGSAFASPPNRVDWAEDGRIEFHAVDDALDRFGVASDLQQEGPPLDMATVESLVFEITISNPSVPRFPVLFGWNGITAPAHFRFKDRAEEREEALTDEEWLDRKFRLVRTDFYLEIYLFGEGLNRPSAWAVMDPVGDGDRAVKAVGYFPGIVSDHYMVRVTALPEFCRTVSNDDGTITFVIDVLSLFGEALAKYNGFPYRRGYEASDFEFWRAGTFAEAGLLAAPAATRFFGLPTAGYTLHRYRVLYTLREGVGSR